MCKWRDATGKIYKREARDATEVSRGKAKHRVRQGKPKQSNGSQGVLSTLFLKVEEAIGKGHRASG